MIKNYTVIIKNVKTTGLKKLLNYFNNSDHKNHKNIGTKIVEYGSQEKYEKMNNEKILRNSENYIKNKKGGRKLSIIGKSLTFNLPKSYQEISTLEKCAEINKMLIRGIMSEYSKFGVEIEKNEIYSVLHHQDNPHFHFILPYLDQSGNTIRDIKAKAFVARLKLLFSQVVDKTLQVDINEYETLKNEDNGQNRVKQSLKEVKEWYSILMRMDNKETTYYKNQIISIERLLNSQEEVLQEQVSKTMNNVEKAYDMRIKNNIKTPMKPFM